MFLSFVRLLFVGAILLQTPLWAETKSPSMSPADLDKIETPATESPTPKPTEDKALKETVLPDETDIAPTVLDDTARPKVPTYEGAFVKMLIVLLVLLFIIFFVIWLMRRLTHHRIRLFNQTRHIKIVERRPLSQKTALYILEIGEKKVLVAESQLEVKTLATFEEISTVNDSD